MLYKVWEIYIEGGNCIKIRVQSNHSCISFVEEQSILILPMQSFANNIDFRISFEKLCSYC